MTPDDYFAHLSKITESKKKEAGVDLKLAIEFLEKLQPIPSDVHATVLAAAKRELERQERERPKRASLEAIEDNLRDPYTLQLNRDAAADILKALREQVVPWLRAVKMVHFSFSPFTPPSSEIEKLKTEDLLRALGEEP